MIVIGLRFAVAAAVVLLLLLGGGTILNAASDQFTIGLQVFGTDGTPPTVPQNVSNTVIISVPQVTVTWDASTDSGSGVAYYNVYRNGLFLASTTALSYTDASVLINNTYSYTVSAVDNATNESAESSPTVANVFGGGGGGDTDPPTVPTGLVAIVSTSGPSVLLTWNASSDSGSGVEGYRLYRDGVLIHTTSLLTFTDLNVATGTTYIYRVSAFDGAGNESSLSAPVSATIPGGIPPDTTPPSVPQNLAAFVNNSAPSVTLTWDPSTDSGSGVSFYRIYRDGVLFATTVNTNLIDTSVATNTIYQYRVSAVDVAGNASALSSPVTASVGSSPPLVVPPSAPTGLSASLASGPSISLLWSASTPGDYPIAGYRIYRNSIFIGTAVSPGVSDTSVFAGSTYTYRVSAYDTQGNESSLSNAVTVSIPAAPPADPPVDDSPPEVPPPSVDPGSGGGGSTTTPPTTPVVPLPVITPPSVVTEVFLPRAREDLGRVARNLADGAQEGLRTIIQTIREDTPQQRTISIGAALTGLLIPVAEFAIAPATAGGSFWYLFLTRLREFGQFLSWLLPWAGFRKRRRPWGTVYDSVTKQPLDPAYVELISLPDNEVKASAITDLDGRFGFTVEPGTYQLRVTKTHYIFPSTRVAGRREDALYEHLYFGDPFHIAMDDTMIVAYDIPMDPAGFDWNEFEKRRLGVMRYYSRFSLFVHYLTQVLFYLGFILAVVILYSAPTLLNAGIAFVYLLVLVLRLLFMKPQTRGRVFDGINGAPLSFATLSIYLPTQLERPIKKVVTDALGRYYCLVRPNDYIVVIEEQLADGSSRAVFRSDVIPTHRGVIDEVFEI